MEVETLRTRAAPDGFGAGNTFNGTMSEYLHFGRATVSPLSPCPVTPGSRGVHPRHGSAMGRRCCRWPWLEHCPEPQATGASGAGPVPGLSPLQPEALALLSPAGTRPPPAGPAARGLDKPVK